MSDRIDAIRAALKDSIESGRPWTAHRAMEYYDHARALVAEVERLRGKLGEAWREGFSAGYADGTDTGPTSPDNPYKEPQP